MANHAKVLNVPSPEENANQNHNEIMDEQNVVYPYNAILFTIKKNEVLIHGTTLMNFTNIILSERSQTQEVTHCMIPFT